MEKDLNYWKKNAEEDYLKVPISVLRYITELERAVLPQENVIKSVCEQHPQPFQTDIIIRFSKLPRKGLIADFSGVGLNQLVEFNTYDFNDLAIFDMQLEHINEIAKELNANFVVYHMGSSDLLKSNTYMMKFTK